jgi:transposase-like protein
MKTSTDNHDQLQTQAFELVVEQGLTIRETAARLKVSSRCVYKQLNNLQQVENHSVDVAEFLRLKNELNKVKAERDLLQDILLKIATPEEIIDRQRINYKLTSDVLKFIKSHS